MKRLLRFAQIAMMAVAMLYPTLTAAQDETDTVGHGSDSVKARFVGVAGGAIAGGELVVAVEAIIGVKKKWPYYTFPILGAAGGGVGGYFLEKASVEGAVALLIGSMALLIPTAIAASSAVSYDPSEELAIEDESEAGIKFSFEETPKEETPEDTTSTEVESRPEGAPTDALPPPGAEEAPTSEPPSEVEEPSQEAPEGGETTPGALSRSEKSERTPRTRQAMAGSLFNVDSDGTAKMAMPFIDIRPVSTSNVNVPVPYRGRRGIEIFVPLLTINLP